MKGLLRQQINTVRSQFFNLDNGSGTTVDEPLFRTGAKGGRLVRVYSLYGEATQTVAGGNYKLGVAAGGATLVAATAYEDSKSVGDSTAATILVDRIPANTTVFVRHTGVASTQTGTATICVEWVVNE